MFGMSFTPTMILHCNDRRYEINLDTFRAKVYDLEGNETTFVDNDIEYNTLIDKIDRCFHTGLAVNLPSEIKYLVTGRK